jgi:hypothetical protein
MFHLTGQDRSVTVKVLNKESEQVRVLVCLLDSVFASFLEIPSQGFQEHFRLDGEEVRMKKELSRLPHGDGYDSGGQKTTQQSTRGIYK